MTERPVSSVLPGREPNEHNNTSLTVESPEPTEDTLPLGEMTITLDDPDFRQGYQEGASQYERWHCDDQSIESAVLLFLIRNGWGDTQHSPMWQTGYIVGWLCSLFAHAHGLESAA